VNLPALLLIQAGAALAALLLTAALTEPARRLAFRYRLTDRPAPHKAHRRPTPYLGGIAIAVGTLAPTAVLVPDVDLTLWVVMAAAVLILVLGLIDDARTLTPKTRLGAELLLGAGVASTGAGLGVPGPRIIDVALTVGWIVVVTNSFNLLDNSDGALATVASATAAPLSVAMFVNGQLALGVLLICLAMSCAGFLVHNAAPARIFMGDAGSLFIGFVIATCALRMRPTEAGFSRSAILFLVVFLAIVDTTLVVISRRRHGRSFFQGGTDHVAHRLRRIGLGANATPGVLGLLAATAGTLAVLVSAGQVPGLAALAGTAVTAAVLVSLLLLVPAYPATAHTVIAQRKPLEQARPNTRG
jgi:UDP-GlcNAc:undecaprenyl-phosphate/decaprenyl-phosphate GlcNAc-1-phosphate transferase